MTSWIGYVGLVSFAIAWIPQCLETVREGRCGANRSFLALSTLGSAALACYAFARGDAVFSALNALTTAGAGINVWFSVFPRPRPESAARTERRSSRARTGRAPANA